MPNRNTKKNLTVESIKKLATPDELELYSYVADKAESVSDEIVDLVREGDKVGDGGLVFVYGPVNSGKTLVACIVADRLSDNHLTVIATQPDVDRPDVPKDRYYSRSGVERRVHSFKTRQDLEVMFAKNDVVIIDEMQFISRDMQSYFLKALMDYIERGGWVVAVGMLYTSQASEFLLSAVLNDRANKSFSLTATCQKCGSRGAVLNQRMVKGMPTQSSDPELLAPSDQVYYEPRCNDCHVIIG